MRVVTFTLKPLNLHFTNCLLLVNSTVFVRETFETARHELIHNCFHFFNRELSVENQMSPLDSRFEFYSQNILRFRTDFNTFSRPTCCIEIYR